MVTMTVSCCSMGGCEWQWHEWLWTLHWFSRGCMSYHSQTHTNDLYKALHV